MEVPAQRTHLMYDIVVMGEKYCGKSSIIRRYTRGKYDPNYIETKGTEYGKKKVQIEDNPIMLHVYDTAGQKTKKSVIKSIYRNVQGVLLVFDFSRRETLDSIQGWIYLIKQNCKITPELMLVGNKVDMQNVSVTSTEAQMVAESHQMPFLEVSARTNQNIEKAFHQLAENIFANRKRLYPNNMVTSIRIRDKQTDDSSCC